MVVFTGKTVEEAIVTGLKELNISRSNANIQVIAKEKKGFLGFGRKPAQVLIEAVVADKEPIQKEILNSNTDFMEMTESETVSASDTVEEIIENDKDIESKEESDQTFNQFVKSEFTEVVSTESDDSIKIEEVASAVEGYVKEIIYEMDVEASLEAKISRRHITLQIETPEPGRIIGYHGKVLKSLQLLAQNFLHDRFPRYYSVSLNVHDYIEHRMETLVEFTKKVSARVLENGKDYVMDPMSNSERKTVHKTVSQIDGVESYSEGNDPNRYVVIVARD